MNKMWKTAKFLLKILRPVEITNCNVRLKLQPCLLYVTSLTTLTDLMSDIWNPQSNKLLCA